MKKAPHAFLYLIYFVYQRENEDNARVYRCLKVLLLRKSVLSKQPQID